MIKIICCHPIFNENAVVLSQKFKWDLVKDFIPEPKDIYIVFGAHEMASQLLKIQEDKKFNFGYIILNVVFDYSNKNIDFLKSSFNIKTYSYFFFEFIKYTLPDEAKPTKEFDIVFVGTKNELRDKLFYKLTNKFPYLNIYFDFDWSYKSSEDLTKLLLKSKVVLNIPYYENNTLETHRINKAISCDCDVISYKSKDDDANEFYKDYIYLTDEEEICDLIDSYFNKNIKLNKKSYQELISNLTKLINPHFLFIINSIEQNFILF